jgi:hypothetical protein
MDDQSVLGKAVLQDPRDLGQVHLSSPKFLRSGRGYQTQVVNNILPLKLNLYFFDSNNIYCKFNNINNNINLYVQVLIFFNLFLKKYMVFI